MLIFAKPEEYGVQRPWSQAYPEHIIEKKRPALRAELALRWRPLEAGEAEQPLARWGATFTPLTTTQVRVNAGGG